MQSCAAINFKRNTFCRQTDYINSRSSETYTFKELQKTLNVINRREYCPMTINTTDGLTSY